MNFKVIHVGEEKKVATTYRDVIFEFWLTDSRKRFFVKAVGQDGMIDRVLRLRLEHFGFCKAKIYSVYAFNDRFEYESSVDNRIKGYDDNWIANIVKYTLNFNHSKDKEQNKREVKARKFMRKWMSQNKPYVKYTAPITLTESGKTWVKKLFGW